MAVTLETTLATRITSHHHKTIINVLATTPTITTTAMELAELMVVQDDSNITRIAVGNSMANEITTTVKTLIAIRHLWALAPTQTRRDQITTIVEVTSEKTMSMNTSTTQLRIRKRMQVHSVPEYPQWRTVQEASSLAVRVTSCRELSRRLIVALASVMTVKAFGKLLTGFTISNLTSVPFTTTWSTLIRSHVSCSTSTSISPLDSVRYRQMTAKFS